jgi:hypothetical protein
MNKKILVSLFICLVFIAFGKANAQSTVELVAYHENGVSEWPWWEQSFDPYVWTRFDTGPLLTLHIPPCKKSKALVFEAVMQGQFTEIPYSTETFFNCNHKYNIISDKIPDHIEVFTLIGLGFHKSPVEGIRNILDDGRKRRVTKCLMERNKSGFWAARDKNTNQWLPDDQVIPILNDLIDKGFDLEVSFVSIGEMTGITDIWFGGSSIFISRINKN